jgi:hypothetical protein
VRSTTLLFTPRCTSVQILGVKRGQNSLHRNMSGQNARRCTRHRIPRSIAPPCVAAAAPPYRCTTAGQGALRACRGAGVSHARAPSRASGREPRRPRGAGPLPAVHAYRGRTHALHGRMGPTPLQILSVEASRRARL